MVDGIGQYVRNTRCEWGYKERREERQKVVTWKKSLRLLPNICNGISEVVRELKIRDWDLEPEEKSHGGKITIIEESDINLATEKVQLKITESIKKNSDVWGIDTLTCLPGEKIKKEYVPSYENYIKRNSLKFWKGYGEKERKKPADSNNARKAVYYESCRGLEGWVVGCMALDVFFESKRKVIDEPKGELQVTDKDLLAKEWLTIPLTRASDHLIIHIEDRQSFLGSLLSKIYQENELFTWE